MMTHSSSKKECTPEPTDWRIRKYLANHAEPEANAVQHWPAITAQFCIVVPCFDEGPEFFERLVRQPLWSQNLLIVVVINQPENLTSPSAANQSLHRHFEQFDLACSSSHLSLYKHQRSFFLVVDRYSRGRHIPVKQGVGLARKIGCDIAVQLYARRQLHSPWIFSADADAQLPENYFSKTSETSGAMIFDFQHGGHAVDPAVIEATQVYEHAIRYYQRCLQWADSPYAFTSLGSAFAVHVGAYCQVRGFPKRSGGEDFYLLNKITKVAPVRIEHSIKVHLTARTSSRTPFGTGPAVQKILAMGERKWEHEYYHPATFRALKHFLSVATTSWPDIEAGAEPWPNLSPEIMVVLSNLGLALFANHLRKQVRTEAQYRLALVDWFDAFKTLKFIRLMQAGFFCPIPLKECLRQAPYIPLEATDHG